MASTTEAPARGAPLEFIALMAMMFATVAFSIDAVLPALPEIATELTPADPNRAQLILTSFVFGMGLGTLVMGPLSDALGRKPVIVGGAVLYCLAAAVGYVAPTLETVLAARVVMGLGVAAPRVVSLAMVRDLYAGRDMARIVSFAMMVFMVVPAAAPLAGAAIIDAWGWRSIFLAFLVFAVVIISWVQWRQPETLPVAARRPLRLGQLGRDAREVLTHPLILKAILGMTLVMGALFATLSSVQQLFGETYGRAESFPWWFALIALFSAGSGPLNARLVMTLGMRRVAGRSFLALALFSGLLAGAAMAGLWSGGLPFWACFAWLVAAFFSTGLTMGNLNALAMEPMGHVAGMAASLMGAISTVASTLLAVPVGLAFNGTPVPLIAATALFSLLGWGVVKWMGQRV
ncbi:multidrug effflux MFS transporter [Neotabrizicola shimadae]|uniref:Multidrug effflux MFS transporter n=1 Tax=Neotabrizicola shimadae TaxID=2807096 RepID=A0A8G1EEA2_9RHOB|nr:multidrug effflux MFS transporter [Neotabrizicola shimadae]QYZ71081.1 multidrug effflux MFS transporter [Neotabrizicola shimadae]